MEKNYTMNIAKGFLKQKAIEYHHRRYCEVGFFKDNDVDSYREYSTYFVAQSFEKIIGVTRLIHMPLNELPTIKEFNIYDIPKAKLLQLNPIRVAEVSAFTKSPQSDCGLDLIKTIIHFSRETGISHWICCIDERVFNYMHRMFKFPFEVIGDSRVYLGSNTIPCVLDIEESLETLKVKRKALYDYFTVNQKKIVEVLN
jgi:N-acyl-L-homoserine lactone synthetase